MFSEDFDFEGEGLLLALPKHFDEERFDHKTKAKKKLRQYVIVVPSWAGYEIK